MPKRLAVCSFVIRLPSSSAFVIRHSVPPIRPNRAHPEEHAEHVLSLRRPGHGLDPQRVHGEQRGSERTGPYGPGHPLQGQEKQQHAARVQDQAVQMMKTSIQSKQLHVQHVRQPGHRMPVAEVSCAECPLHIVPIQPGLHSPILVDVGGIIEIHETIAHHRPKGRPDEGRQREANQEVAAHVRIERLIITTDGHG